MERWLGSFITCAWLSVATSGCLGWPSERDPGRHDTEAPPDPDDEEQEDGEPDDPQEVDDREGAVAADAGVGAAPDGGEESSDAGAGAPVTIEEVGQLLFEDQNLSLHSNQSCASCHAPELAFTGNDLEDPTFPVARGSDHELFGERNVPSASYSVFTPPFSVTLSPTTGRPQARGGFFWDGRADDLATQAKGPFLNPVEMGMKSAADVVARVREAAYADAFLELFGQDALDDADAAFEDVAEAIAAFESSEAFGRFSSKFDAALRGEVELDEREQLGFALFKDPEKGNCAGCHTLPEASQDPRAHLFTSFAYRAIGVPRNPGIPANSDPAHFDLGLCRQPELAAKLPSEVTDPQAFIESTCGQFRVPSLRNVAKTAPYMHNGVFDNLHDVVAFYATRESHPERWYGTADDGSVLKYDDLPEEHRANVSSTRPPFALTSAGLPRLDEDEIDAIVTFLQTLDDGFVPPR